MRTAKIVLETAAAAVCGDRNADYGPPIEDFKCQATMMSAYLSRTNGASVEVRPNDIASLMAIVKLARQAHAPKTDNWVDLAGYAACGAEVDKHLAEETTGDGGLPTPGGVLHPYNTPVPKPGGGLGTPTHNLKERVLDLVGDDEEVLLADGFEDAFVGVGRQFNGPPCAVYDRSVCIAILMRDGMDESEAEEYFSFNVEGAWVGENTPIFVKTAA